ncbi:MULTISPECIES: TetR/AcrR family transcriptional regulator [Streptomyces]|uniref:TetR/AcrR family transcriptional regulator C-terminal domain-containing protein n=1 Tax=Streptomyces glycanivorans TaxID=3033808 RepID=A0ABY9JC82_9ACTN|nr:MULTISPECIES: TetR/AcrR family transcriptional regulator C-terminal domain-containing protein [unclassified Streptomyces]WSQ78652.1 TetR/AcrR family transcriptional regulator C-terminal domain-containing protein [Streptomyces sp. NBC_01213]TXS16955.1 TetR family transcriptional regulator [Streptomyces sp. wa22]WLQ65273.1 TetR/AcrR family transcriptional regulator C-terminal domain-containing protein [Streptomyces sp. Alt3]WSQ86048.1 TetR/AcrR family transcriptional regulator C-terminal domai
MGSAADRVKNPSRVSVWLDRRTPSRTRKADQPAGLDRDRITAASVRLLDADGLAKFSMRRLAADLDVTAMSLYWYVDTKDDLLELALDTVFGEIPATAEDLGWHDRLRELATNYRRMLVRHPWVSTLIGSFLNIGPHSMLFSYAVQDVIRATGLPLANRTGAMSAVFQFVYGFGTIEGHFVQRTVEADLSQDEYFRQVMGTIRADPEIARAMEPSENLMEARGGDTVEEMRERDFVFALDLLIAGIEAMCDRAARRA